MKKSAKEKEGFDLKFMAHLESRFPSPTCPMSSNTDSLTNTCTWLTVVVVG